MLAAGENLNHIEKVKATTSQAQSTFKWCSDLGVEWNRERVGVEGGHSVPREMTTKSGFGSGIVIPEFNKCKELGVRSEPELMLRNHQRARRCCFRPKNS